MMKYLPLYGSVILLDVGGGAFSTQNLQFDTPVNNFHGLRFLPLGVLTMLQRVPADC